MPRPPGPRGSNPWRSSLTTSGSLPAASNAAISLSRMAGGKPAGAAKPSQPELTYGNALLLRRGHVGHQRRAFLAGIGQRHQLARSRPWRGWPARKCAIVTWPPIRSVIIGLSPLYGTCSIDAGRIDETLDRQVKAGSHAGGAERQLAGRRLGLCLQLRTVLMPDCGHGCSPGSGFQAHGQVGQVLERVVGQFLLSTGPETTPALVMTPMV
jgi:hypothetical protein